MDKNTKNIIEAGITDKEFARIVGHLDFKDGYLDLWSDQKERNYGSSRIPSAFVKTRGIEC